LRANREQQIATPSPIQRSTRDGAEEEAGAFSL
jgi:hypothetical protein